MDNNEHKLLNKNDNEYAKISLKDDSNTNGYCIYDNITYFGINNGFNQIKLRLANNHNSFLVTSMLISTLSIIIDNLDHNFAAKYIKTLNIVYIVNNGLKNITDNELKTLNEDSLSELNKDVSKLLQFYLKDDEITNVSETMTLNIALRLLSANILKQKIHGMTHLAMTIEGIKMSTDQKFNIQADISSSTYNLTGTLNTNNTIYIIINNNNHHNHKYHVLDIIYIMMIILLILIM